MNSEVIDGKVLDWHFKKMNICYFFYIGDIYVGQLFKTKRNGWIAVSDLGKCEGFITRWKGCQFLLDIRKEQTK